MISSPSFRRLTWYTLLLFVVLGSLRLALAEDVGEIVSALGTVEVLRQGRWQPVATGEKVAAGEAIKTGEGSRIALQLVNGAQLKINANSQLELKHIVSQEGLAPTANAPTLNILRVPQGEIWVRSNGIPLELQTISVVATIRGTEFNLAVKPDHSARLAVFDGLIDFHNAQGSVLVEANEQATVRLGEAPRKTVLLNPIDAAQWSLYYPGTVSYRDYLLAGQALPHPNGRSQKRPIAASQATVEQLISQAETRFNSGNRQEARQLFAQALQHDPDHPHARTGLGWTLLEAGAVDAALAAFQQVRPPTLMSAVGTANSLYQLNRFTQADQVIAETQRQFPQASLPWVQAALNALIRGRVDEAHRALDQALTRDPRSALAHSLRSNIYLVQNQKERALEAAERAVAVNPSSPTAYLNLSLVKQAEFNLNAALAAAQKAVALDPENPQALIQESRLLFGMGDIRQATQLAQQAYQFRPGDSIVHSTWGFLQLAQGRIQEAIQSFQEAIAQDSTLGEPHLGLGIALFRQNQTEAATQEILKATLLEPKVSLYSSYLGKAFYELKDDHATQKHLAKAKQLDPHDPTPHFYDALRLQSYYQPIESIHQLQQSIDLNDNRAVYRSQLLLDEDLATRGTALGRIYNEVGFEQLSLYEAHKSLTNDPTNYSAHRLLADSYSTLPRHEIARASELLQAQLLQPINIAPVQPQLAETKLGILTTLGPVTPSLYEYNSLFLRNHSNLALSGLVGNHDTLSDEAILSGLYNQFSYSLGHFHYQTNGFRENNDFQHDLYNLFTQVAVTPNFNLQAELRRRETDQGDLSLYFSAAPSTQERLKIRQDTARLGTRYTPSPQSNVIVSFIHADREDRKSSPDKLSKTESDQLEGQYLFRELAYNIIAGGGLAKTAREASYLQNSQQAEHTTVYGYANIALLKDIIWTVGLSHDHLHDEIEDIHQDQLNPKLGFRWNTADNLQFRLAAFSTLKRALVVEQTIEPTQIAGFDQFYDDLNGTKAKIYAIGLDAQFNNSLYGGIQGSYRDLDVPFPNYLGHITYQAEQEQKLLAYLYWMPHPYWAIQNQVEIEKYDAKANLTHIETLSVPLTVRYFRPSGFFAELGTTYVWQQFTGIDFDLRDLQSKTDHNDFVVVNAAVGFRLPKQQGSFSLEVSNLFDQEFQFQDMSFRNSYQNLENPRFIPDRTILSRIKLNF